MTIRVLAPLLSSLVLICSLAGMPTVLFREDGLSVATSSGYTYRLTYPELSTSSPEGAGIQQIALESKAATVHYAGGGSIRLELSDGGEVLMYFDGLPSDTRHYNLAMDIPAEDVEGSSWEIGDVRGAFPQLASEQPHLFQGNDRDFALTDQKGDGFAIRVPDFAYQQLTDKRKWGLDKFTWSAKLPYNPDWKTRRLIIAEPGALPELEAIPVASAPEPREAAGKPAGGDGIKVSLAEDAILAERSDGFKIGMGYPELGGAKTGNKIVQRDFAGRTVTLTYGNGARVLLTLEDGGEVKLEWKDVPTDVTSLNWSTGLGFGLINGGKWTIGEASGAFPPEQPASPHLFQGNANHFVLTNIDGQQISIEVPDFSYQELNDARQWNWKKFFWKVKMPLSKNRNSSLLRFTDNGGGGGGSVILVDRFGQNARMDWPDKVHSEEELQADMDTEEAFYASFAPRTDLDAFGGLNGSGARLGLQDTGYFHVQQKDGRWYLVSPEGNLAFHLGVCSFLPSTYSKYKGYERFYEWVPPQKSGFAMAFHEHANTGFDYQQANMIRKYGPDFNKQDWYRKMVYRAKQFGFNSAGEFSGALPGAPEDLGWPYVTRLPNKGYYSGISAMPGIRETFDPFDAKVREQLDKNMAEKVAPRATDPYLIGYFISNEPYYEDVATAVPGLKGSESAAKRRLVQMLRDKYPSIAAFNRAWDIDLPGFDAMEETGLPVLTETAHTDMQVYLDLFMDEYFRLQRDLFRKYDPNHMLIGSRMTPRTSNNQRITEIAGQYVDIFSINYYSNEIDQDFLEKIHTWAGRPLILSEFYWGSTDDSGLAGSNREVDSQQARGLAYRDYVEEAASLPYVVGVEWFTLNDYPMTGMWWGPFLGHNPNSGLFAVTDRPWKDAVREMAKTNYVIYDVILGKQAPFQYDHPKFSESEDAKRTIKISQAHDPITIDGRLSDWPNIPPARIPGARMVKGKDAGISEAEFFLAWDERYLYVLAAVKDATPRLNSGGGGDIWRGDGVELFIGSEALDAGGALRFTDRQVLLSAGKVEPTFYFAHAPKQYPVDMVVLPAGEDGYVIEAAIPWEALAIQPRMNQDILFDFGINNSDDGGHRSVQLMWNGRASNSGDRTYWGRAQLVQ